MDQCRPDGLGAALFYTIGFEGIAAATAFASWLNVAQMVHALRKRGDWTPSPAAWSKLARIAFASAVLGGLMFSAQLFRAQLEAPIADLLAAMGTSHGAKEVSLLLVTGLGGLVYLGLAFATRAITVAEVRGLIRRSR